MTLVFADGWWWAGCGAARVVVGRWSGLSLGRACWANLLACGGLGRDSVGVSA